MSDIHLNEWWDKVILDLDDDDEPFDPACCGDPASCNAACRNSDGTPWRPGR